MSVTVIAILDVCPACIVVIANGDTSGDGGERAADAIENYCVTELPAGSRLVPGDLVEESACFTCDICDDHVLFEDRNTAVVLSS